MGDKSGIEWCDATWNPVTGCDKISQGCKHCYAETMAERLRAMGQRNYADGFNLTLQPHMLELPLRWRRPRRIFVNSMSDLFHQGVPLDYIKQVFSTMTEAHWHTFLVLTKRSQRLVDLSPYLPWTQNVWMGVSVERAECLYRVDDLRKVPAAVRFLSCEPLLGPLLTLDLTGIHWVIVGGESGPRAREMKALWAADIRAQCIAAEVPFFFKQWGEFRDGHRVGKRAAGRELDGRTWDEFPELAVAP